MEKCISGALGNPFPVTPEGRLRQFLIVLIFLDFFEDFFSSGFRHGEVIRIFDVSLSGQQIVSVRLFPEIRHGNREFIRLSGFAPAKRQTLINRDRLLLALLPIFAPLCLEKNRVVVFEKEFSCLAVRDQLNLLPVLSRCVSSHHEQVRIVVIVFFINGRDNIGKLVALRRERQR